MIAAAFILGLVSSLHCIGMCGPIALMLPVDRGNAVKKLSQIFVYHFGRLSSYAAIGLLFGILGRGFYLAGIQQKLSIFAGIAMIAAVLLERQSFIKFNVTGGIFKLVSGLRSVLGNQFRNKSYRSFLTIGLLNGMLPCGIVYAAVFGALAMQDVLVSPLFMVFFGLGTIPLMTTAVYFGSMITLNVRNKIQKAVPYAIVFLGMLFIIRGTGLDIPYISPSAMSLFVQPAPDCH